MFGNSSEIRVELIGFTLENNGKNYKVMSCDHWNEVPIFILVTNITHKVELKIDEIRKNTVGIVRRIKNKNDILELLLKSNPVEARIITDTKHSRTANRILESLKHEQKFVDNSSIILAG